MIVKLISIVMEAIECVREKHSKEPSVRKSEYVAKLCPRCNEAVTERDESDRICGICIEETHCVRVCKDCKALEGQEIQDLYVCSECHKGLPRDIAWLSEKRFSSNPGDPDYIHQTNPTNEQRLFDGWTTLQDWNVEPYILDPNTQDGIRAALGIVEKHDLIRK